VSGSPFPGAAPSPEPPTGLAAVAGTKQVSLSWTAPAGGVTPETYEIYRDGTYRTSVPASQTSFVDTGLADETQYCYQVSTKGGGKESAKTSQVCATTPKPPTGTNFKRGDTNADGGINLTDAVVLLGYLFLGNPTSLSCQDAADANDSGDLNLTDAVYGLGWMFLGNPTALPAPGAVCGVDPTNPKACVYLNCPQ
jgi:chitodextrinase